MKRNKGFTLVELLVVISIIALLMGMLMPALGIVKKRAKKVMCMQQLRGIGLAFMVYTVEYEGKTWEGFTGSAGTGAVQWFDILSRYIDPDVFRTNQTNTERRVDSFFCPSASKTWKEKGYLAQSNVPEEAWAHLGWYWEGTQPPPSRKYPAYSGSYSLNVLIQNPVLTNWGRKSTKHWRTTNIKRSFEIPLLAGGFWLDGWWQLPKDSPPPPHPGLNLTEPLAVQDIARLVTPRHDLSVNNLFLDGSVRNIALQGVWQLRVAQGHDALRKLSDIPVASNAVDGPWPEWLVKADKNISWAP